MKYKKRKIVVFTGNRAEYGLLSPIIKSISDNPDLDCVILASGAHLQEDFGYTKLEIEKDGFQVYAEIKLDLGDDTLFGTVSAIGTGILSLSRILKDLNPDFFLVYADRFEGFAAMITGTQMNIPTAHIEGGDITEGGALDDSVRHAMTKLAHIHFTTNIEASERIRKMGEESWRIHTVGLSTIDLIKSNCFISPEKLQIEFDINIDKPIILFTQHSVTTEYENAGEQVRPSLGALEYYANKGCQIIITYPNNDAGCQQIIKEIKSLDRKRNTNIKVYKNLGRDNYYGFLNICGRVGIGVCIGNSSSGIKETPAFGCPTVNIGERQQGRLRASNVIDVEYDKDEIIKGIKISLFDEKFRRKCKNCNNPYGEGMAGKTIAEVIANVEINNKLLQKKMTY
jgi:UDP-hydrolysing UDP-N-acetyl-D-glucosamine 2-epimerase